MFDRSKIPISKYPKKPRSCTDILCCLIFLLATVASIVAAIYGLSKGNTDNILQPFDSSGNACGRGELVEYQYLYFNEVTMTDWTKKNACVKSCPIADDTKIDCFKNKEVTDCGDLKSKASYAFADRFCWPKNQAMAEKVKTGFQKLFKQEAFGDVMDSWKILLFCFVIAFLISIVYLWFLETCALTIVTLVIVLFIAALTVLGLFLYRTHLGLKTNDDPHDDDNKTYLYLAIGVWAVEIILIMCFCCLWSRIKLAARIIEATADYLTDIKRIIIIPLILVFVLLVYILWWVYSGAHIFSIGDVVHDQEYPWGEIKWEDGTK